jgi:hypothetical protein
MKISNLDSILDQLHEKGWHPPAHRRWMYSSIMASGLQGRNLPLAIVAVDLGFAEHPLTLRGLMYRVVSAGWLPSTDKEHYKRLGRVMTTLRERKIIPFNWLVDNIRSTIKPSSWSGLASYVDTVREAYRKNFWASLPEYVHVIVEKDAIAGTLSPVTEDMDVRLSPIRGYVSLSFAHEIAETWNQIEKPIHAYYLGDFDASGFDLERDLKAKLERYCKRQFTWTRLAVNAEDFETFKLIPLKPKKSDRRYKAFVRDHGSECAELDAIPATELRRRVKEAIDGHIPQAEWQRLQEVERVEKESFVKVLDKLKRAKVA